MAKSYFAAIDMGTNSFHLIIVEVQKDGSFIIVDREREVIRLGSKEGTGLNTISEEEMARALKVLKKFKKLAAFYDAPFTTAATSAVREAGNQKEFIDKVYNETGIVVNVIEGVEEAYLIYLGAKKALNFDGKKVLCIDIGGGSTEFLYADDGKIIFADSIKIGSVRLSKAFFKDFILTDEALSACEVHIENMITASDKIQFNIEYDIVAGTSGSIQSTALLAASLRNSKPLRKLNGFTFNYDELDAVTQMILGYKTKEERLSIPAMEPKRADIIPAGLLILKKAFQLFGIKQITVSEYALKEGIVVDMIKKLKTSSSSL